MNAPAAFVLASLTFAVLGACPSKPSAPKLKPEVCPATAAAVPTGTRCNTEIECTYGTLQCSCRYPPAPAPSCHGDNDQKPDGSSGEQPHLQWACAAPPPRWEPAPGCPAAFQPKSAQGDEPACDPEGKLCTFEARPCCERKAECREGHWDFAESCVQ